MDLLLATGNPHKVEELSAMLEGLPFAVRTTDEFPDGPDVEEAGETYEANAILKARAWADHTGLLTLADDSGLDVDALDGRPGIYSSRYAPTNDERIARLLNELEGVEDSRRTARFVCVMALAWPEGGLETRRGVCEGRIAFAPAGDGGFGYDPVFYLPDHGQTMAQLPAVKKNRVSHRARALQATVELLRQIS